MYLHMRDIVVRLRRLVRGAAIRRGKELAAGRQYVISQQKRWLGEVNHMQEGAKCWPRDDDPSSRSEVCCS